MATVALTRTVQLPFDDAVAACRTALQAEGFGVLTEIDIQSTLHAKLGVEPYLILGACHPPSAHRVLEADPEIGVLLPCNVTISVEGGSTIVRAMDPSTAMGMIDDETIAEVAVDIRDRLERAITSIG